MAVGTTTAAVLGGLAAAGTVAGAVGQNVQANRAESEQRKANDIQQAGASVEAAQRRRRAIAASRIQRAQNIAQGVDTGLTPGSSQTQGANASLASNLNTNIANNQRTFATNQATFDARQKAQDALQRGRTFADFANIPNAALGATAQVQSIL